MKIALVILHADARRGGAERYTLDLAAALAKRGHDVTLLATTFRDVPENIACVPLPARGITRARRYVRMLSSLDSHLAMVHHDIVHAMLPVHFCDIYHPHAGLATAAISGWRKKLKAILNPRRITFAVVERRLLKRVNPPITIALSNYVRRSIVEHYSESESHLATLFNAVDLERFRPNALRNDTSTTSALFIGQDFDRKGLPHVLEAMRSSGPLSLRERVSVRAAENPKSVSSGTRPDPDPLPKGEGASANISLTIVGGQKKLSSDPRVKYIGTVTDSRPFYREADFFVLPTHHDPCSLVVLEALAVGLPVITSQFNGAAEIMTDGVHGFVLDDPSDVATLADRMWKLCDPKLRAEMSAACLALRPRLSYEHHLDELTAIYNQQITNR